MNIVSAAIYFLLALMLALAGVTRVGAWLIERRNPPAGAFAVVNGTRMHFVHVAAPANARPAADRFHSRRQRQSERPDGAAQAFARRPRRAAVLRPAGTWLVRARFRKRDAVRPGQNACRIDGRARHRPGDHRRPLLRCGRGGGIRARLPGEDARPRAAGPGDASVAGRRDLLVLFADGRCPSSGGSSPQRSPIRPAR